MYLRDVSGGAISGTGTIDITPFGVKAIKVLITTNNTNAATVTIRKNNDSGQKLIDVATVTAGDYPSQCVLVDNTQTIYYSITGTGASAQILGDIA